MKKIKLQKKSKPFLSYLVKTTKSDLHHLYPAKDNVNSSRSNKPFGEIDDNITSNVKAAKEFLRALIPYNYKWVSQMSINAAHDEEFLDLLQRAGCQGVLIGFE